MSKIAYLGPPNDHWNSLNLAFQRTGISIIPIFDSLSFPGASTGSQSGWVARAVRMRAQIFGTSDRPYLKQALRLIDESGVTCVLAFWGTRPLPDIRTLKQMRPQVRFVLTVLCHPLGLNRSKVRFQHLVFNHGMRDLDGLIVSSLVMQRYLEENVPRSRGTPMLLQTPCWAEEYARHVPLTPAAEQPNVIFLGRMDWRAGQSTDNVTGPLRELMGKGIDVYFSQSPESEIAQEHAYPFKALKITQVGDFAARFDASLILYDLSQAPVKERFEVTIPDRLITSVAAGIPIALPAKGFAACKEYLQSYGAVLEFLSMGHLSEQLRDRKHVEGLRNVAWERSKLYRAEEQLPDLMRFLQRLDPDLERLRYRSDRSAS